MQSSPPHKPALRLGRQGQQHRRRCLLATALCRRRWTQWWVHVPGLVAYLHAAQLRQGKRRCSEWSSHGQRLCWLGYNSISQQWPPKRPVEEIVSIAGMALPCTRCCRPLRSRRARERGRWAMGGYGEGCRLFCRRWSGSLLHTQFPTS